MADEDIGGTQPPGGREMNDNKRDTGAQKFEPHPESHEHADALRNSRNADEKKGPDEKKAADEKKKTARGLTAPVDEVDDETHQSDGVDQDNLTR